MSDGEFNLADDADLKQAVPRRSHPAKYGEGFDAPPTLERSGSEHRRAVTSPLPEEEGLGEKVEPSLAKEGRGGSKKQHSRAVTSFPLMVKGKAWLGIKDPPAGEGQVGQKTPPWLRRDGVDRKNTSLAKEKQAESKKPVFEFTTNFSKRKETKKRGFLKKKPRL